MTISGSAAEKMVNRCKCQPRERDCCSGSGRQPTGVVGVRQIFRAALILAEGVAADAAGWKFVCVLLVPRLTPVG